LNLTRTLKHEGADCGDRNIFSYDHNAMIQEQGGSRAPERPGHRPAVIQRLD
jgi:hypothetical protein